MSWRLVEGVPLPEPVGGHPALDFCNTRAGWGLPDPKEYLTGPRALLLWVREAGLLPAATVAPLLAATGTNPDAGVPGGAGPRWGRALRRALRLRSALYAVALGGLDRQDWELVSAEAVAARAWQVLLPGSDPAEGPGRWQPRPLAADLAGGPCLVLAAIASAAEQLLTSPLGAGVSACPGDGCGWLFADPRGRRRWCSMAVCGNRAKARRHAQRGSAQRG